MFCLHSYQNSIPMDQQVSNKISQASDILDVDSYLMTSLGTIPETRNKDDTELQDLLIVIKALKQTFAIAVSCRNGEFTQYVCKNVLQEHIKKTKDTSMTKRFKETLKKRGMWRKS